MQARALGQPDSRRGKTHLLTIPEADRTSRELDVIKNAVEASRSKVMRIAVSRCIKKRRSISEPIPVERQLQRRHLRIDATLRATFRPLSADHLVKRVIDAKASPMPISSPSEVRRIDPL